MLWQLPPAFSVLVDRTIKQLSAAGMNCICIDQHYLDLTSLGAKTSPSHFNAEWKAVESNLRLCDKVRAYLQYQHVGWAYKVEALSLEF